MAGKRFLDLFACVVAIVALYVTSFGFHYFICASLVLCISVAMCKWYFCGARIQPKNKAVFITGCDSGFGNALAKRLDSKGFQVFAACEFPDGPGASELGKSCSEKLQVVHLDVTNDESVKKAASFVKHNLGAAELWAIVNNAGIYKEIPIVHNAGIYKGIAIDRTPMDVFRGVMEVNGIGPVRVTKAFLLLLSKSRGRVVNVISICGRVSPIGMCAYNMSKHAALAFTECLSQEMNVWGIRAITIEPETFRTPLNDDKKLCSEIDEEAKKISGEILTSYGKVYLKKFKQWFTKFSSTSIDPFIDDMESAIMDKYPKRVYKPRWSFISRTVLYLSEVMPFGLFEFILNLF